MGSLLRDQLLQDLVPWLQLSRNGISADERVEGVSVAASSSQPLEGGTCGVLRRLVGVQELAKLSGLCPSFSVGFEIFRHPPLVPLEALGPETSPLVR